MTDVAVPQPPSSSLEGARRAAAKLGPEGSPERRRRETLDPGLNPDLAVQPLNVGVLPLNTGTGVRPPARDVRPSMFARATSATADQSVRGSKLDLLLGSIAAHYEDKAEMGFLVDLVNDDVSKARKVVLEVGGDHLAIVHPKRFDVLRHFEYDELIGWRSNQAGFFWYISHVLPEEGGSFDEQWSVATDEGATIAAIVDAATTQEASKRESMRESQREAEEEEEEGEAPPDLEGMTEKI